MSPHQQFISRATEWAGREPELLGLVLVGSYARGEQGDDSDIDLVMIARNPSQWLETNEWLRQFGRISKHGLEDYGLVQSRRVFYENGIEVEFGITSAEWLKTDPIDEGTRRVLSDGYKVLDDKAGLFKGTASEFVF